MIPRLTACEIGLTLLNQAMNEHIAFIGLGSNIGDRAHHLATAGNGIAEVATILKMSSQYETEPVGFKDQPWFLNQVLMIGCDLSPFELLRVALAIEQQGNRSRDIPQGPRTIDVDLLFFDAIVMDAVQEPLRLIIPHPRLHLRKFVLVPLCEIAPLHRHPVLGLTVQQLLSQVEDGSQVKTVQL